MSARRYPLSWPANWPRVRFRRTAAFKSISGGQARAASMAIAIDRLQGELDRLGARDVILSTNVELRLDGQPRGDPGAPADPGAAIYFQLKGRDVALACDKWDRVADNVIALAKHIEALRGIERWGVGTIEQAFRGYEQLPAPGSRTSWRELLGVSATHLSSADIDEAYRRKAASAHPDRGGSNEAMAELNRARAEAKAAIA